MVRRVLAGLIAGACAAPVFIFVDAQLGTLAGCGVLLGVYGFIDWLGVLPSPFEPAGRSLLHAADDPSDK